MAKLLFTYHRRFETKSRIIYGISEEKPYNRVIKKMLMSYYEGQDSNKCTMQPQETIKIDPNMIASDCV